MSEEKLEELKQLLFQDRLTDYGKRQLVEILEEQQKEIEEYKKKLTPTPDNCVPIEYQMIGYVDKRGYISKDKIKEKINELEKERDKYIIGDINFGLMKSGYDDKETIKRIVNQKDILKELLGDE